jgi:ABC-type dipeptide/oligopeptide/nickel transport system ATPase component
MYRGELVEQWPMAKVLADPQHDYTKRLLAGVPRLHGWGAPNTAKRKVMAEAMARARQRA